MRQALGAAGFRDRWLPPLAVVMAIFTWQAIKPGPWRIRASYPLGMLFESLVLAVALIGMSRLVDLMFDHLEGNPLLRAAGQGAVARGGEIIGYLGAGVYEETLFRLMLIPTLFTITRILHAPEVLSSTIAITGSALLFSLAHHVGIPGEGFTLFAFIFRWLAGIFFAWVFLTRGFGIAVGTHAAYDILVGWAGFHF